jgi:hypothetical protein
VGNQELINEVVLKNLAEVLVLNAPHRARGTDLVVLG